MTTLSPRESEVASLVSRRMTDAEIGRALGISRWTVREYLRRIWDKTGIRQSRSRWQRAFVDSDRRIA